MLISMFILAPFGYWEFSFLLKYACSQNSNRKVKLFPLLYLIYFYGENPCLENMLYEELSLLKSHRLQTSKKNKVKNTILNEKITKLFGFGKKMCVHEGKKNSHIRKPVEMKYISMAFKCHNASLGTMFNKPLYLNHNLEERYMVLITIKVVSKL